MISGGSKSFTWKHFHIDYSQLGLHYQNIRYSQLGLHYQNIGYSQLGSHSQLVRKKFKKNKISANQKLSLEWPKLRFEPVSFLFLVCFWIVKNWLKKFQRFLFLTRVMLKVRLWKIFILFYLFWLPWVNCFFK